MLRFKMSTDSRLCTWAFFYCYLHKVLDRVQLILFSGILNQLQNWIMRELEILWVLVVPTLSSYIYHNDTVYEGWIDSKFILMHNFILVIT